MNLLFVNPNGTIGGAERVLLAALSAVRRQRPESRCTLLTFAPGPLLERAEALGVETLLLPAPSLLQSFGDSHVRWWQLPLKAGPLALATWRYVRELRATIERLRPDLIHSNGIKSHALLGLAGVRNTPIVWHVHDFLSRRRLAQHVLGRFVRNTSAAIAISRAVATDLHQLWPQLRVQEILNGIDTEAFAPAAGDPALLDKLAELPPCSCIRIGLIATYARWKGQDVLLRAAAQLRQARPDLPVRFYVVGGPIYQTAGSQWHRAELQALASQLGLDDTVGFIEFQADVSPIYQALDIVVHASTAPEPFGLTIAEAMACGKAVIVSQAGGAAEIADPGRDALGFSPGNVPELAAAIAKLVADAHLRSILGQCARKTVVERFDEARFSTQLLDFFDEFEPAHSAFLHSEHREPSSFVQMHSVKHPHLY